MWIMPVATKSVISPLTILWFPPSLQTWQAVPHSALLSCVGCHSVCFSPLTPLPPLHHFTFNVSSSFSCAGCSMSFCRPNPLSTISFQILYNHRLVSSAPITYLELFWCWEVDNCIETPLSPLLKMLFDDPFSTYTASFLLLTQVYLLLSNMSL